MSPFGWFSRRKRGRVIVLGVDGMDARLTEAWMGAGDLPNLAQMARQGGWAPLATTNPAESPVAWASFATGLNPGKHGIFDFLQRNPEDYALRVGPLTVHTRVNGQGLEAENHRRGETFWGIAGRSDVECVLLRVPGTCPPEVLRGKMLSGLGVPDLLGSWGTSFLYTTAAGRSGEGIQMLRRGPDGRLDGGMVQGPLGSVLPLELRLEEDGLQVACQGEEWHLKVGQWSPWFSLCFTTPLGTQWPGVARFYLMRADPEVELYLAPINIDPRDPALPLTFPPSYIQELVEKYGLFDTLGWPEDASGLNAGRLDEQGFMDQVNRVFEKQVEMIMDVVAGSGWNLLVSVLEVLDRVQHMCWRSLETDDRESVVRTWYRRVDDFLARLRESLGPDDSLILLSDHGFRPVHKLVHVNAWLRDEGYLTPKAGANGRSGDLWADVDWRRTRAYALGLSKIYINLAGREGQGRVNPGREYDEVCQEIAARLLEMRDPESGEPIVRNIYRGRRIYSGSRYDEGGDLILGFHAGYRTSQSTALGRLAKSIIVPNRAKWGADHCSIDPPLVPGVLAANRRLDWKAPSILDLAPTILELLGLDAPSGFDGRSLVLSTTV